MQLKNFNSQNYNKKTDSKNKQFKRIFVGKVRLKGFYNSKIVIIIIGC